MWILLVAALGMASAQWCVAGTARLARSGPAVHPQGLRSISVIIPARDEEANIADLLDSLTHSSVSPAEVIVVDDSSSDATAGVAARHGATVITVGAPPDGLAGKPWACAVGARAAAGDRLLFLDADTRVAPEAIDAIARLHDTEGGLVSVQPHHVAPRGVEQLSLFFNAAAVLGSGAFAAITPTPSRVAFGPCLYTSRADYERVGGHAAVAASVVEDIALARRYEAHGMAVTCRLGGGLVRFRMYPTGLRSIVQGWTKNIALGAAAASRVPMVLTVIWIASLAAVATSAVTRPGWTTATAYVIVAAHLWVLARRLGTFHPVTAAIYPLPLLFFLAIFLRSATKVARGTPVTWKRRSVATRAPRAEER
jgi:4,4'-diaponeurosporenoate glycosyltransferase